MRWRFVGDSRQRLLQGQLRTDLTSAPSATTPKLPVQTKLL